MKKMVVNCKICDREFIQRHPRYICCSQECSKKNKSIYNNSLRKVEMIKTDKLLEEFRIPKYIINQYGEDILRENKELLETLQIINRLTGHHYVSEEDRKIRNKIFSEQHIQKRKLETAVEKICKCCGKTFTKMDLDKGVRNSVTCSKECSKGYKKINRRNWSLKQRNKKLEI